MTRRPSMLVGWIVAVLAMVLFVRLGSWQTQRAGEKQAMLDAAARVLAQRHAVPLSDAAGASGYAWAAGAGRFEPRRVLWLDNQQRGGRAGVRAYGLFAPEPTAQPHLLVDLGWLPLSPDRTLPDIALPRGRVELRGMLAPPPSAGLALGAGIETRDGGWLLTRVDPVAIAKAAGVPAVAPRVLRLDPALPFGYERDLELLSNTLPPEKHRGYAVQWFALALAVLATALLLTFRALRSRRTD